MVDDAGNAFVTGHSNETGNDDYFTIWYDPTGTRLWSARFNSVYNRTDKAAVIRLSADGQGDLLVTGRTTALDFLSQESVTTTTVKYKRADIIIPPDGEAQSSAIYYIKNNGQILDTDQDPVPDIKFYSEQTYPGLYFFDGTISMVLSHIDEDTTTLDTLYRVDITFGGNGRNRTLMALEERDDYYNYYLGHIPEGRERVPLYQRVIHYNAFEGIDLHYTSNTAGVKYDFVVKPGAGPEDIELIFNGQTGLSVNGNGELVIETTLEDIVLPEPVAYQIDNGVEVPLGWTPGYNVLGDTVNIVTGTYDNQKPLIIRIRRVPEGPGSNPECLLWSTYYGSGSDPIEYVNGLATDAGKNLFVAGGTPNSDFPVLGLMIEPFNLEQDVFLLKFDISGVPQWGTFIGGSFGATTSTTGDDLVSALGADKLGNLYITGFTGSWDFPLLATGNAYMDDYLSLGAYRAFIAKFDQKFGTRKWSTFFAMPCHDDKFTVSNYLAITPNNHLIIVGTYEEDVNFNNCSYPLSNACGNYYQDNKPKNYIAEFNTDNQLCWGTRFGESCGVISVVEVDDNDNIFIAGTTCGVATVTLELANEGGGYSQTTPGGNTDAFIAKFDADRQLYWSTYFGGGGIDEIFGLALNSNQELFVLGGTTSSFGFPLLPSGNAYFDGTYNSNDYFIAKFLNNGQQIWTTYYGGSGIEFNLGAITVDDNGIIYILGTTESDNMDLEQVTGSYFQDELNNNGQNNDDNTDAFILTFTPDLQQSWTTFFGGFNYVDQPSQGDFGLAIESFKDEFLFISGSTRSKFTDNGGVNIPLANPGNGAYFQPNLSGNLDVSFHQDAYIAKFCVPDILIAEKEVEIASNLIVFPVPSHDYLYIDLPEIPGNFQLVLSVCDVLGKKAMFQEIPNSSKELLQIDISNLSPGVYSVTIETEDKLLTQKFIKL